MSEDLEYHELANVFPLLEGYHKTFKDLKADIQANGQW
jgi:hypothetical protein